MGRYSSTLPARWFEMDNQLQEQLDEAIWADDAGACDELAPCECCCAEHTHLYCPARYWNGCRSGLGPGEEPEDGKSWAKHYAAHHGMTEAEFYGLTEGS
jgi:hypothetical protein